MGKKVTQGGCGGGGEPPPPRVLQQQQNLLIINYTKINKMFLSFFTPIRVNPPIIKPSTWLGGWATNNY